MMIRVTSVIAFSLFGLFLFSCGEESPSRDHMPVLQKRLYQLQVGVANSDRAAIDSLLSVDILSIGENSDSLLSFIYGSEGEFAFERFGNYQIYYTDEVARIDCYVMDSLGDTSRPVILTFVNQHDLWLLKRFEAKDEGDSVTVSGH